MAVPIRVPLAAAIAILAGCSSPPQPAPKESRRTDPPPAKITQFYSPTGKVAPGERVLLCFGVENAKTVWLSPPRTQYTASVPRCVEAFPKATTTYTLTAEGSAGPPATLDLTIQVGAPRAKIIEVTISSREVERGKPLSLCYRVENAVAVRIDPIHFEGTGVSNRCISDQPLKNTTYIVTAVGKDGDKDQERVPVTVR